MDKLIAQVVTTAYPNLRHVLTGEVKGDFNGNKNIMSRNVQLFVTDKMYMKKIRYNLRHHVYVVWQKSNETNFLLTLNFILFTNQGYPLQNSSLGQLHSDGGVVSIVRSSAGSLLLVYLSARRLRSSGYYPKYQNGAFSSGF